MYTYMHQPHAAWVVLDIKRVRLSVSGSNLGADNRICETDHSVQILDFEILVPRSTLIALHNDNVGIAIAYTASELHLSRYVRPRNDF